jgi:antitoxin YefM
MITVTASKAKSEFLELMDRAAENHEAVQIIGKRRTAVLIAEEDWLDIQKILYKKSGALRH